MKKFCLWLGLISVMVSLVNWSVVAAANKPMAVTANTPIYDLFGGSLKYQLNFWNVGDIHVDKQYAVASISVEVVQVDEGWNLSDGGTHQEYVTGTFSGGPNGKFNFEGITGQLQNGQTVNVKIAEQDLVFTVDNPDAFANWIDEENLTGENYDQMKLPSNENWDEQPTDGMLDTSYPIIDEVMGEVNISDPDKPASIWQKSWSAITGEGDWRNWESAGSGQSMKSQTSMKTGAGRALIQFKDGTKFILERDSQITFNASGGFTVETGGGYMEYKKYGQKIILQTRRGKFAIVGTTVNWKVDGDHIQFGVIEGLVEVDPDDGSETTIWLEAGEEVMADEFGMSGAINFDPDNSWQRWQTIEEEIIAADAAGPQQSSGTNYWWWVVGAVVLVGIVLIFVVIIAVIFLARR
jgi:hypothetical protein